MRILLAEDDKKIARAIGALLKRWGHEVFVCFQGDQALQILEKNQIDLLLADWLMPGVSGIDLVRAIKASPQFGQPAILMISGKAEKSDILEAIQAGINGFLAKPFSPEQLKEKIATLEIPASQAHRQDRTGQDKAGQDKAGQDKAGQDKAGQDKAGQDAGQDADQNTAQDMPQDTTQDKVDQNKTGVTLIERLKRIFQGENAEPDDNNPLVIFTENAENPEALLKPTRRPITRFLLTATEAVNAFNVEHSDVRLGYLLRTDVHELRDVLRHPSTRERVKLVLVHLEADKDEHFLFARLVSINQKRQFSLVFLCDSIDDVPEAHRAKFKQLGIGLFERSQVDAQRLRTLLATHILASIKAPTPAALSPDEVRQRVLADLEDLKALPPLPRVYHRIDALARTPGSDLGLWVRALQADPITCATILRHARSPLYGFHERVEHIDRALILLGKRVIRDLVSSEAVKRAFKTVEEQGFSLDALWLHSVAVGSAAHLLAFSLEDKNWSPEQQTDFGRLQLDPEVKALLQRLDLPHRLHLNYTKEHPFMAGMVHDIGKVVMAHAYPGLYPLLVAEMERRAWTISFTTAEREVAGGLTHTIVGELLATAWDMDASLCRIIQNHHQPEIDDTFSFLIGIADFIGQSVHPFPQEASYPIDAALEDGNLRPVEQFLPAGFFDQPLITEAELLELTIAIRPIVAGLTKDMQHSIG